MCASVVVRDIGVMVRAAIAIVLEPALARVCFAPSPPLPLGASWCGGVQRNTFTVNQR